MMTSKEKNLIYGAVVIVLVLVFWYLLYQPINTKIVVAKGELNQLNTELNLLATEYTNKSTYLDEINEMEIFIAEVEEKFPSLVPQEKIIYVMKTIENEIESLTLNQYNIALAQSIVDVGENINPDTKEVTYNESLLETKVSLSIDVTYADIKKLLAYIAAYDEKLSVTGLIMTSDLENNLVSSTFDLNFYALLSADRPYIQEDYFGPFEPKEDAIFTPFDSYGAGFESGIEVGESVLKEDDDIIINLSSSYSDQSTVIIYEKDAIDDSSYLYYNINTMAPLEVVLEQKGILYYYKYRIEDTGIPANYAEGIQFTPGQIINIGVFSSARVDELDISGVDVTVTNNTDLVVEIETELDDKTTPRFNLLNQSENVKLKVN